MFKSSWFVKNMAARGWAGGGGRGRGDGTYFPCLYIQIILLVSNPITGLLQKNNNKKKKKKKKKKTMCTYSCVFIAHCTSVGQVLDCVADLNFSVYRGLMPDVMCLFEPSVVLLMVFFSFGCRCRKRTTSWTTEGVCHEPSSLFHHRDLIWFRRFWTGFSRKNIVIWNSDVRASGVVRGLPFG